MPHSNPRKSKEKKKNRKKKKQRYCPEEEEEEEEEGKKKKKLGEHMGIFVNQEKMHPHCFFSPFWRENILVGLRRKHLGPTIYFHSFPLNQTHQKNFLFHFLSEVFHLLYFTSNQTHP